VRAPSLEGAGFALRLAARRRRHRRRGAVARVLIVAGGVIVALAGVVATIPLPELGLPLLLAGLDLLALEFDWAARATARVYRAYRGLRAWVHSRSRPVQGLLALLALAVAVAAGWLALSHLPFG